ncbi:hypothetical protein JTE90_023641, partial [Oedothorax gibbosus]
LADFPYLIVLVTRGCSLGDLLRIWGRTGHKLHYLLGFSRANRGHPDTARDAVLLRNSVPIPDSRFPGTRILQRKDNSSRGLRHVSDFRFFVTALGPEGPISVSGLGNINPIPFRSAARQTRACVCVSADVSLRTDFSDPLGPTDPCSTAVPHGTLLQLAVLKALT